MVEARPAIQSAEPEADVSMSEIYQSPMQVDVSIVDSSPRTRSKAVAERILYDMDEYRDDIYDYLLEAEVSVSSMNFLCASVPFSNQAFIFRLNTAPNPTTCAGNLTSLTQCGPFLLSGWLRLLRSTDCKLKPCTLLCPTLTVSSALCL